MVKLMSTLLLRISNANISFR